MKSILVVLSALVPAFAFSAETPAAIPLWEKGAPGSEARMNEPEKVDGSNVTNIHHPSLTPYLPGPGKATGTAVIICPGGGHSKLCMGHEGYEWLHSISNIRKRA